MSGFPLRQVTTELLTRLRAEVEAARMALETAANPQDKLAALNHLKIAVKRLDAAVLHGEVPEE